MNIEEQIRQEAEKQFTKAYPYTKIKRIVVVKMTPAEVEDAGLELGNDVDLYSVQIYISDSLIERVDLLAHTDDAGGFVIENDTGMWDLTLKKGMKYTRKG